jgi:hypothetical protein
LLMKNAKHLVKADLIEDPHYRIVAHYTDT